MTLEDLGARMRQIVCDHLTRFSRGHLVGLVRDDTPLVDGPLNLDSLDFIEITMEVEDQLDIELVDERVTSLRTVGDFIVHVAGLIGLAEVAA